MSLTRIIKLQPEEWAKYKKIRLEALQSDQIAFAITYAQAILTSDKEWEEKLANQTSIFLFAAINEEIVGTIGAYLQGKNEPIDTAVIVGVYVHPDYRGQKIGKKLLQELLQEISSRKGIATVKLWVSETQKPARALYESFGFSYIGKEKKKIKFQGKEYDELIMKKELA